MWLKNLLRQNIVLFLPISLPQLAVVGSSDLAQRNIFGVEMQQKRHHPPLFCQYFIYFYFFPTTIKIV